MGIVLNPCLSILAKYFDRYKRLASSLAMAGMGVGSFVAPPIIKTLEDTYGWRGAMLLVGGLYAHVIVLFVLYKPFLKDKAEDKSSGNCNTNMRLLDINSEVVVRKCQLIQERPLAEAVLAGNNATSPPINSQCMLESKCKEIRTEKQLSQAESSEINMEQPILSGYLSTTLFLFKRIPFLCLCLYTMLNQFPFLLVYTHAGTYVLSLGYSTKDVVILYIAMGITSTVARVLSGILADCTHVNIFTLVASCSMINGMFIIALPFTDNLTLIYVYATLFCLLISPYNALNLTMVIDSVPKKQVASAYGIMCFFRVPGTAFGAPLAGKLRQKIHKDSDF